MADAEVIRAVRETCEQIAERHDYELVELKFGRRGKSMVLSVTVDHPRGVALDEITEISEEISRALDYEDPIAGSYTLEVSSPGIERPLIKPTDFSRFQGREVNVKLSEPIEGSKRFQGSIRLAGGDAFVLELKDGVVVEIPYPSVSSAKLVVDWEAELKKQEGR